MTYVHSAVHTVHNHRSVTSIRLSRRTVRHHERRHDDGRYRAANAAQIWWVLVMKG